jgi:hypothetical protein
MDRGRIICGPVLIHRRDRRFVAGRRLFGYQCRELGIGEDRRGDDRCGCPRHTWSGPLPRPVDTWLVRTGCGGFIRAWAAT